MFTRQALGRVFVLALASAVVAACGAAASEYASAPDWGGQTGSLVPKCLVEGTNPFVVTEGDTVFAQQMNSGFVAATLKDAAGNVVPISELREGNTSVLHTDQTLAPGTYTLTDQCPASGTQVSREIVVLEATALPEALGTVKPLSLPNPPFCSELGYTHLAWTPASEFMPYVNLTEFTLFEGTQRVGVIAQSEPFALNDEGAVELSLPLCPATDTCVNGGGQYHVEARIAGETGVWSSATFEPSLDCKPDPIQDEAFGCSVAHTRGEFAAVWFVALTWGLWAARRCTTRVRG